jgi:dTDP-4-dehydrorhamnose 3,5-epimerase
MKASEVTVEWLGKINYKIMPANKVTVEGVVVKDLVTHVDGRGEVTELWSEPWVEKNNLLYPKHVYQSATDYGVVKCWHLHDIHTDQFTVTRGKLQVSLVDLRRDSPSFGHANAIFLGSLRPRLIKIPPMIMHGWKALSQPEVLVVNLQSHVYIASDEFKFPWDCVLPEIWEPKNG